MNASADHSALPDYVQCALIYHVLPVAITIRICERNGGKKLRRARALQPPKFVLFITLAAFEDCFNSLRPRSTHRTKKKERFLCEHDRIELV